MALEIYMIGVVTKDMGKALEFYQRLGLAIPEGAEGKSHVQIKMGSGLTFFLDSQPSRWDPGFTKNGESKPISPSDDYYPFLLEFYLKERPVLDAKYQELMEYGYSGLRAPYITAFGMYFAFVKDPDGNAILLSAD
jgi:hypothetical protein